MTCDEFRIFQSGQPDEERWELIAGTAVPVPPSTIQHNVLADNLCRLLGAGLRRYAPSWLATRAAVSFGSDSCLPEPDVAVIDAGFEADRRFADRAYLLAEIETAHHALIVSGTGKT